MQFPKVMPQRKRNSVGVLIEQNIGMRTRAGTGLESATQAFHTVFAYVLEHKLDALSITVEREFIFARCHVPESVADNEEVDWALAHEAELAKRITALESQEADNDRREAVDTAGGAAPDGSEEDEA